MQASHADGGLFDEGNSPAVARGDEAPVKVQTLTRSRPKLGRNDPCWCGSGKKYKKCHMKEDEASMYAVADAEAPPPA